MADVIDFFARVLTQVDDMLKVPFPFQIEGRKTATSEYDDTSYATICVTGNVDQQDAFEAAVKKTIQEWIDEQGTANTIIWRVRPYVDQSKDFNTGIHSMKFRMRLHSWHTPAIEDAA